MPGFGGMFCARLAGDTRVAFIKWFYFLAVFKGVFKLPTSSKKKKQKKKHPSGYSDTITLVMVGI